jgi:hypothetical protein
MAVGKREEAGQLFLTRLTAAGRVDRSFGKDGLVGAYAIRGRPIGLVRTSDGTRDRTFGPGGKVAGPAPFTTLHSLVETPGGVLVAAGSAAYTGGESPNRASALVVERLDPAGAVDTDFGAGAGYVITSLGPELNAGVRDAVAMPGQALPGRPGRRSQGETFGAKIVLAALEPDGSPAPGFGREGVVITDTVSTIGGRRGSRH